MKFNNSLSILSGISFILIVLLGVTKGEISEPTTNCSSFEEQCSSSSSCCSKKNANISKSYVDLVCFEDKCLCPNDTYFISDKSGCIKTPKVVGDYCENNSTCKNLENTSCLKNQCTCNEHYFSLKGVCKPGIGAKCSSHLDCLSINIAFCSHHRCKCPSFHLNISPKICIPYAPFNETCQIDEQCSYLTKNALCRSKIIKKKNKKVCACDDDYFYSNNHCYRLKRLSEPCTDKSHCGITSNSTSFDCINGLCKCTLGYQQKNSTYCGSSNGIVASALFVTVMVTMKFII